MLPPVNITRHKIDAPVATARNRRLLIPNHVVGRDNEEGGIWLVTVEILERSRVPPSGPEASTDHVMPSAGAAIMIEMVTFAYYTYNRTSRERSPARRLPRASASVSYLDLCGHFEEQVSGISALVLKHQATGGEFDLIF
jgi:hypothetical protein